VVTILVAGRDKFTAVGGGPAEPINAWERGLLEGTGH
jgi:hypothetical protein